VDRRQAFRQRPVAAQGQPELPPVTRDVQDRFHGSSAGALGGPSGGRSAKSNRGGCRLLPPVPLSPCSIRAHGDLLDEGISNTSSKTIFLVLAVVGLGSMASAAQAQGSEASYQMAWSCPEGPPVDEVGPAGDGSWLGIWIASNRTPYGD